MNGLLHCLNYGEYPTKSLYRCPPRRKVADVLDNRPLADQNYADVEEFLQQQIGENLTLDYKRELSTSSNKDRAELCKDVSALVNSRGGMIIYGVDEDSTDRTPQLPPAGTPRTVGRQSVEEWAAQVLRSGVQPPWSSKWKPSTTGAGRKSAFW